MEKLKNFFKKIVNSEGRLYRKGLKFSTAGKYNEAMECFDEFLLSHPNDSDTYSAKAGILYLQGLHGESVELYDKAISLDENNFRAHYNKGLCYHREEKLNLALKSFKRVSEINPKHIGSLGHSSLVLRKQKKYNEAIMCLTGILKIKPKQLDYHYEMACVLAVQDNNKSQKNNKKKIFKILEELFSKGYLFKKKNKENFLKDDDFNFYRKDKDFEELVSKLI